METNLLQFNIENILGILITVFTSDVGTCQ